MNFIMNEPREVQAELVVNNQSYQFAIKPTKEGLKWKLDITLSSPSLREKKTHSVTLRALMGETAVIGFALDTNFHRRSEKLIDFSDDLTPDAAAAIKNIGETILLTVTQHDQNLTWSLQSGKLQ